MAKKLTAADWDDIQANRPARRYILSIEDGTVRVVFDSELISTEPGEEDMLGYVWEPKSEKKWTKVEAKARVNGEPKVFSMGGVGFSFCGDFISLCKANGITPDKVPGSVFDITKTGDWTQEIKYVGREDTIDDKTTIPISEDIVKDIKETLADLKENSPDILKTVTAKSELIKILAIRSRNKPTEIERALPEIVKAGILKLEDDRVDIL